jgi:predicted Fe-Mo cluster-binding NifX family protein
LLVKIVIPVSDKEGKYVSEHFGRAPFYAWFNVEDGRVLDRGVTPNDSSHFGGRGLPPERMMSMGAEIVISSGMGQRAIAMFQNSTVAVLRSVNPSTEQSIKDCSEGRLVELTEGCLHAHEHAH